MHCCAICSLRGISGYVYEGMIMYEGMKADILQTCLAKWSATKRLEIQGIKCPPIFPTKRSQSNLTKPRAHTMIHVSKSSLRQPS